MKCFAKAFILLNILAVVTSSKKSETVDTLLELFGYKENAKETLVYQRTSAPCDIFTSVVSFRFSPIDFHFCSGTLISPRHVLTSASCLDPKISGPRANSSEVSIGICGLETSKKDAKKECGPDLNIKVSAVVFHPKYTNGKDGSRPYNAEYDIAVAILKKDSKKRWALLPLEPIECCKNTDLINLGWGRFAVNSGYATSLEIAGFKYLPYSECKAAFKKSDDPILGGGRNMSEALSLCVEGKYGEEEYCQLGSGTGLMIYNGKNPPTLVGFASKATAECSFGDPYVFSSVSPFVEWIQGIEGFVGNITKNDAKNIRCPPVKELPDPKTIGGVPAAYGRFSFMVSIRKRAGVHLYQGVLIDAEHVLTVGTHLEDEDYEAIIGAVDSNPKEEENPFETIAIKDIIYHPQIRNSKRPVNLAILILSKKSKYEPIRLPFFNRRCCDDGTKMRIAGWGSTSDSSGYADDLQVAEVTYISRKRCLAHSDFESINPTSVCAGGLDESATLCRGDDGAPLMLTGGSDDILIGIGFADTYGGCEGRTAQYQRIAFFLPWIKENVPSLSMIAEI